MSIHEQARAEAEKRGHPTYGPERGIFADGYLAGHEAATRTRVVTTVTELDALPVGTVLAIHHEDGSGPSVYVNARDEGWLMATERCEPFLGRVDTNGVRRDRVGNRRAPLTVLYDPEETR